VEQKESGGMRVAKTIYVQNCDFCDSKDETHIQCYICGADVCYKCKNRIGRGFSDDHENYPTRVDKWFCLKCLNDPPKDYVRLIDLYLKEEGFRLENAEWIKRQKDKDDRPDKVALRKIRK
jgi:hypothetical protein